MPSNGQAINLFNCSMVPFNQKFNFTGSLVNDHGFCLDRGAGNNGTSLTQQSCSGSDQQMWTTMFGQKICFSWLEARRHFSAGCRLGIDESPRISGSTWADPLG
jgi:hypothetical protein